MIIRTELNPENMNVKIQLISNNETVSLELNIKDAEKNLKEIATNLVAQQILNLFGIKITFEGKS